MFRAVVYSDDMFEVVAEADEEFVVLHCEVFKWSKSCKKKMLEVWPQILEGFWWEGYDEVYTGTPNPKFVKMLGGATFIQEYEGTEVYKWELN